jgi:hypothetical protein
LNVQPNLPSLEKASHAVEAALYDRGGADARQAPDVFWHPRRARRFQERIQQFRQPIGLCLDLCQKFSACVFVPVGIWSTQTTYKSLDVTQWQTDLVCRCR